jgi:hypothetical protein
MPKLSTQHCVAKINETTLISMGGYGEPITRDTFFYDSITNSWTQGPSFAIGRNSPACGVLNWVNPNTGDTEKVVVAAGGSQLNTVELLFLDNLSAGWLIGRDLPFEPFGGTITEYQVFSSFLKQYCRPMFSPLIFFLFF